MTSTKIILAGAVAGVALVGASLLGATPSNPDETVTKTFNGIPVGAVLTWNNGKYVPKNVAGYQSAADYPDSFWVYPDTLAANKTKLTP